VGPWGAWEAGGWAPAGELTVGPGRAGPRRLAAHQGHLQGHALVPALRRHADVAGDDGGDEGVGDLPVAVGVSLKDLSERVMRAGGLQPPPIIPSVPTLSSWPALLL